MSAKILLIGGSGFVSGTLARRALAQGHQVWAVTRGQRPTIDGVQAIIADRKDREAFAHAIATADTHWDLVVDCIGFQTEDAQQAIEVFATRARHLVFISTDFTFDPVHRRLPQSEETDHYAQAGYGGDKRRCEEVFTNATCGDMAWTILRPCHIYGPGSLLGCLPAHGRDKNLIAHLRSEKTLALVGGGYFLQQPIFAPDLAELALSCRGNGNTYGQIFCAAGPDIIESRTYYQIIADHLGVALSIEELPVDAYLRENPNSAPFLCHRIYDMGKLKASAAAVPSTPIAEGLRQHVDSLLD
jgi:nucleoside-diphosphate-sugar epimerase